MQRTSNRDGRSQNAGRFATLLEVNACGQKDRTLLSKRLLAAETWSVGPPRRSASQASGARQRPSCRRALLEEASKNSAAPSAVGAVEDLCYCRAIGASIDGHCDNEEQDR
jgi:hypothetical protein